MFIGTEGVYSYTFEHEKRKDCPVCGGESVEVSIPEDWTVERLIEMLVEKQDMWVLAWCLLPIFLMSLQPDQEAFTVDGHGTHLLPGPAAA
jgi:hypothetical protein